MNKLIYKGHNLCVCEWQGRQCFLSIHIAKILGINSRSITDFVNKNGNLVQNEDYTIIRYEQANGLRAQLKEAGYEEFFIQITLLFPSGLQKYLNKKRNSLKSQEAKEFSSFLTENGFKIPFDTPKPATDISNDIPTQETDTLLKLPDFRLELLQGMYTDINKLVLEPGDKLQVKLELFQATSSNEQISFEAIEKLKGRINATPTK